VLETPNGPYTGLEFINIGPVSDSEHFISMGPSPRIIGRWKLFSSSIIIFEGALFHEKFKILK